MNTNSIKLKRRIMRKVYYTFATRIVRHPITLQVGLFTAALFVFADMVHVSKVIENLLQTSVGSMPTFVLNALMRGEVLTLIAIGVMVFVALSLPTQAWRLLAPRMQHGVV